MFSDYLRRLRYRRALLRRLPAADPVSWIPPVRLRGRSHGALSCDSSSRISYDVTLPHGASIVSWCALTPGSVNRDDGPVEFEIHVRGQDFEASARCAVDPRSWRQRRWHFLRVRAPGTGPARIVLSTRISGNRDRSRDGTQMLWGDPCIQVPRSAAAVAAGLRGTLSSWGLRGLWHRTLSHDDNLYGLWVRENSASRRALSTQRKWALARSPLLTIVTFVTDPAGWQPERTVNSLLSQSSPQWEWIVVAAEGSLPSTQTALARFQGDPRVRTIGVAPHGSRADAWNAAFREARGTFAALLDQDDVLSPEALYEMAAALDRAPESDLLYSDEDRIARRRAHRYEPRFKPDWSPDLLLAYNYIGRLAMIRVGAALAAGGFRNDYGPSEEWDLLLRLSRLTQRIRRVPRCLYHRTDTDGPGRHIADDAGKAEEAAVRDHCEKIGSLVAVSHSAGRCRVTWPVHGQPTVSIVIPNRNAAAVLTQCVNGLRRGTRYPHRELVIVDNGSTEPAVLDLYRSIEREGHGIVVPFDRPFNFSAACNQGAAAARGDLLLFLNNDIEIIDPEWLDELARWALRPDVGIVGAKLLYPDRTIQHAGVVFGLGLVGHIFSRATEDVSGPFGSADCYRNYLGVTGACQMMRRDVFERLGGYDERYRLSFSDIVLCMEAWKAGYRVVYNPYARLVHHESYTRKREDWPEDQELLVRYLEATGFEEDPYFHPELNPRSAVPALRPPYDPTPRQAVHDYVQRVLAAAEMAGR